LTRWSSEAVVAALGQWVSPDCRLILLPADARGEEVAALLAERLETDWIADALTLAVNRAHVLEINAVLPGGKLARTFRATADRPIVVTMRPGVPEAHKVDNPPPLEVRVIDVDLSAVPELTTVERFLPADPRTVDLVFAQRIVSAGRGTGGPEGVRLVAELTDALGASLGASRLVVDLGWAPAERQVGQTGRTVRPDLYVACGISGASHHLAGMRDSKHIIAINPDAAAPIHEVAHLSLPGDLHQVIPAIQAALQRRTPRVS
jgi:electron transfer flavoprotein alpha subunit